MLAYVYFVEKIVNQNTLCTRGGKQVFSKEKKKTAAVLKICFKQVILPISREHLFSDYLKMASI